MSLSILFHILQDFYNPSCQISSYLLLISEADKKTTSTECLGKLDMKGVQYRGKVSVSESGLTCQRWDSQFPNKHNYDLNLYYDKYVKNTVKEVTRNSSLVILDKKCETIFTTHVSV